MTEEIWKDIPGYEGRYQASNIGNIRSIATMYSNNRKRKQHMMKPFIDRLGYVRTTLSKNHRNYQYPVHRLVAMAFIPNPNNLPHVNHKDENKQNNCVENLEWCDAKYNTNFGTRCARISGEKHGLHKLTYCDVEFIRSHYHPYDEKYCQKELAHMFNVSQSTINAVINHKTWSKYTKEETYCDNQRS